MKETIEVTVKKVRDQSYVTTYSVRWYHLAEEEGGSEQMFLKEEDAEEYLKTCPSDQHTEFYVEEDDIIIRLGE